MISKAIVKAEETEIKATEKLVKAGLSRSIIRKSPPDQRDWLLNLGRHMMAWGNLIDFSIMREAEILYSAWRVWEADDPAERLHPDAISAWQGNFYTWAKAYMKRRGREQADESIQNKIRVYREWVSPEKSISVPDYVCIPKRNAAGIPDPDPEDLEDWQQVETEIDQVDYSKLLIATARARNGLGAEAWTALFDPNCTVGGLQRALREDRNGKEEKPDLLRFFLEEGVLYARENGLVEGVAMFLTDQEHSPLFTLAAEHVLKSVGIKENPFILTQEKPEAVRALAWVNGDEMIVCSRDGYRIGAFGKEAAAEILRTAQEFVSDF